MTRENAPSDTLAAMAAAGALPQAEVDDTIAPAAARFDPAVVALAAAAPPVAPPPRLKVSLLAALPADGPVFRFAHDGAFEPVPRAPGVFARVLHIDRRRHQFTALLRLEPGAKYPAHAHDGPEECLVLEGELLVGDVRLRAGDYQRMEGGTDHADQWTDTGALLYLTAPLSLLG